MFTNVQRKSFFFGDESLFIVTLSFKCAPHQELLEIFILLELNISKCWSCVTEKTNKKYDPGI